MMHYLTYPLPYLETSGRIKEIQDELRYRQIVVVHLEVDRIPTCRRIIRWQITVITGVFDTWASTM